MPLYAALLLVAHAQAAPVEALVYSTTASRWSGRPELAMDGDDATAFRTYRGFASGDAFVAMLSRPVDARSIRVTTGDAKGADLFGGVLEVSTDGTKWVQAADFDAQGVAEAKAQKGVAAIRLKTKGRRGAASLVVREIRVEADAPIGHALRGPGRGFVDLNGNDDVKSWADKAEAQMESFWAETDALLYSDDFVPPNAVHVVYSSAENLPPGMNGGGVMTVDANWARKHPEDTALTVHEMAHSVQAGGSPGWLVEAIADYVRWIKFEPQNFTYRIDMEKGTPRDPYRSGAAFLAWCENHYDPRLVTKLYDKARFGKYKDELFLAYCGKDIDTLYKEFVAAYKADPKGVLVPPAGTRPRDLPTVAGRATAVEIPYSAVGFYAEGTKFRANGGFDDGGAAYAGTALGRSALVNGVRFNLGPVGGSNFLAARGQTIRLTGRHRSLWVLAAAVEGSQQNQTLGVTYDDGMSVRFDQSFSDWAAPEGFPGEVRAVEMPYRLMANGARDENPFFVYAYGFPLDATKGLRSVTLPSEPNVRILAISVAD